MATYTIEGSTLTGIADAIREKTGDTEAIAVTDMATQISAIVSETSVIVSEVRMVSSEHDSTTLTFTLPFVPKKILSLCVQHYAEPSSYTFGKYYFKTISLMYNESIAAYTGLCLLYDSQYGSTLPRTIYAHTPATITVSGATVTLKAADISTSLSPIFAGDSYHFILMYTE